MWGTGICTAGDLIDLALERGVLRKNGSWLAWGDENLGQGREAVRERLRTDPVLADALGRLVRSAGSLPVVMEAEA